MSSFTTPADLRMLDDYRWQVLAPFEYHVGSYPSSTVISVPVGADCLAKYRYFLRQ